MSGKKPEKQPAPAAPPMQFTINPVLSIKLQRHQLKMSSLNLMLAEFSEDTTNLIAALLLEIQKLQTENENLKKQLGSQKKPPA